MKLEIIRNFLVGGYSPKRTSFANLLGHTLRIIITLIIFWFLFWKFDVVASLNLVSFYFVPVFVAGCGLVCCSLILNSMRWYLLIGLTGTKLGFRTVMTFTFLGHFFNQVLPTSVGGDVVRGLAAQSAGLRLDQAVISVVLDRIVGLSGLLILIIVGQPLVLQKVDNSGFQVAALVLIFVGILGLAMMFLLHLVPLPYDDFRILRAGRELSLTAWRLVGERRIALLSLMISICVHTSALVLMTWLAHGLGIDVSFLDMLLIVPTVLLLSSLPVTIGGWGLREAGLAAGFVLLGHPAGPAITVSIFVGLANLVLALPGAAIWLFGRSSYYSQITPTE